MKFQKLLVILFMSAGLHASAQQQTLSKSISDDGKTLHLKVKVDNKNTNINYDKKYDISKMNKEEVNALVQNTLEGLGVAKYFPSESTKATQGIHTSKNESKEIERVILNYVEAFYEADSNKAHASIATDLAKTGYYTNDGKVVEAKMNFDQFIRLSQRWKNSQNITPESPRKITVFEILDKMATAKVEAQWGIDYFHLAKINDKWIIKNVLWQEYPKKK